MFANVILPKPIAQYFSYAIPSDLQNAVAVGSRVLVQFGRKRWYSAVVQSITDTAPADYEVKQIAEILDQTPIVTPNQLSLWEWVAEYYSCTVGEVYRAAVPAGLKLESETKYIYNIDFEADHPLDPKDEAILNFVRNNQKCTTNDVEHHCEGYNPLPRLLRLVEQNALLVSEELRDTYKPKTDTFYRLAPSLNSDEQLNTIFEKLEKRAPKQVEALMYFLQKSGNFQAACSGWALRRAEVLKEKPDVATQFKSLVEKGILTATKENISRIEGEQFVVEPPNPLSPDQQRASEEIHRAFIANKPVLLHGVTGSGKTEIYISLIDECIRSGRNVLYLLPEIALTTQITARLKRHFGPNMGVYHSKFSDAERVELWRKQLSPNPYKLILGVRSSVFLPLDNLGLIIVDEEHEPSYKQYEPTPRYNARDLALVLGNVLHANVVLGSATPSFESYNNALTGKYAHVALRTRYSGLSMPEIIPIDMREARHRREVESIFSFRLRDAISSALKKQEQVILFQNRRGFSPYIECSMCAWVPRCNNCDVSLTYHKFSNQLVCHYCGYNVQLPQVCPACGIPALRPQGYGTEKIVEEAQKLFPQARIVRVDQDSASTRRAYERIISDFENYKYDILVGTQMISKGFDFERVNTVGIMNADNILNMSDFRAYERCFQLISQVAGRAGRHSRRGQVYLQTSQAYHDIIRFIVENNFEGNAKQQLEERRLYSYPPFTRLIAITLKHRDQQELAQIAASAGQVLRTVFGSRVLGPQEPAVNRIATFYLQKILIKVEKQASPSHVKKLLIDTINGLLADPNNKGLLYTIDVDPA